MLKFNRNAVCKKCGGSLLSQEFIDPEDKFLWFSLDPLKVGREYILRTCRTCRYAWPEAPLDADARSPLEQLGDLKKKRARR